MKTRFSLIGFKIGLIVAQNWENGLGGFLEKKNIKKKTGFWTPNLQLFEEKARLKDIGGKKKFDKACS